MLSQTNRNFTIALLLLVCFSFFRLYQKIDNNSLRWNSVEMTAPLVSTSSSENANTLRERFHLATETLQENLREEYGQYYQQIFRSNYSAFFEMGELSKERLVRRLTRKLAESLLTEKKDTTFTWVTTGHSAAAGHGNLFNQSYTHVMETMVAQVFSAAGLTFVGKNYAMGSGMQSGPEQALCMESLYGSGTEDIDVLSYDYDITDGRDTCLAALWGARGANHPSQPTLVIIDRAINRFWPLIQGLENEGVGVIHGLDIADAYKGVPDYEKGQNQTSLPKSLRHFVCNGIPETGLCKGYRWDTVDFCEMYGGQVPWHHGWKHHHLQGVLLGHFMISMLKEAVDHFTSLLAVSDPESILDAVKSHDMKDQQIWKNSEMMLQKCSLNINHGGENMMNKMWPSLYKGNSMCSSALMPSEERLSGILTGTPGTFGGKYDEGMIETDAIERSLNATGKNISMAIVQYPAIPVHRFKCKEGYRGVGPRDLQDVFYVGGVRAKNIWHTKTVPSDEEYLLFSKDDVTSENYIMICGKSCDEKGKGCVVGFEKYQGLSEVLDQDVKIFVDNKKVKMVQPFGKCHFLYPSKEKKETWISKGDKPGQYEISIKTNKADKALRIQSFVVIPFNKKN